jgi:hypothetical protein
MSRIQPSKSTATFDAQAPAPPIAVPASHPDANVFADVRLSEYDPAEQPSVDLVIAGAGPSGLAVAERVSSAGFSVVIVDPNPLAPWINNYGVWCDEFEAMGLDDCYDVIWPEATVYLDNSQAGERYVGDEWCGEHSWTQCEC